MIESLVVCSAQLSKKLRKWGINSGSLLYWGDGVLMFSDQVEGRLEMFKEVCSAYNATEITEQFPQTDIWLNNGQSSKKRPATYHFLKKGDQYITSIMIENDGQLMEIERFADRNEANCRAKALIFLLENKMIGPTL